MRTATSAIEGLTTADETVAPSELGGADGGKAETAEMAPPPEATAAAEKVKDASILLSEPKPAAAGTPAPHRDVAAAGATSKAMPRRRAAAVVPTNKGKGAAVCKRPAAAENARKGSGR